MTAAARRPLSKADALAYSRHAARIIAARPELASLSSVDYSLAWLEVELRTVPAIGQLDAAQAATALRQLRQRVVVATTLADLQGSTDLGTVCAVMSRLAEFSIEAALDVASPRARRDPWRAHRRRQWRGPATDRRRHGQARRRRAQRIVRHRPGLRLSRAKATPTARAPAPTSEFFDRLGRRVIARARRASPPTASCSASTCACARTATADR